MGLFLVLFPSPARGRISSSPTCVLRMTVTNRPPFPKRCRCNCHRTHRSMAASRGRRWVTAGVTRFSAIALDLGHPQSTNCWIKHHCLQQRRWPSVTSTPYHCRQIAVGPPLHRHVHVPSLGCRSICHCLRHPHQPHELPLRQQGSQHRRIIDPLTCANSVNLHTMCHEDRPWPHAPPPSLPRIWCASSRSPPVLGRSLAERSRRMVVSFCPMFLPWIGPPRNRLGMCCHGPLECWLGWPASCTLLYFGMTSNAAHRVNEPAYHVGGMGCQVEQAQAPSRLRLNRPEPPHGPWQIFIVKLFRFL
jgi:hypothetical protein